MNRLNIALALVLAVLLLGISAGGGRAQDPELVSDLSVSYAFGEQVTISGTIKTDSAYDAVDIQLSFAGDPRTLTQQITPDPDGSFIFVHRITERFIPAFSVVTYSFAFTTTAGEVITTPEKTFHYTDNRFDWFLLESSAIDIHWYEGDTAYARRVLDAAVDGMNRARALLEVDPPEKIDIYAYASLDDYTFSRGQLGQRWAGGHADPSTGIILVSLPPGGEIQVEIERKIPHEVAHILLFQATGAGFGNLPAWLNEGFASMMETFPNADYGYLAAQAQTEGRHIRLEDLCDGFPGDASGALLSYAESTLFVTYLTDRYGPAGLRAVVDSYASGAGCTQGTMTPPINLSLSEAEADWQATITGSAAEPTVIRTGGAAEYIPLLIVLAAVIAGPGLVLIGSSMQRRRAHGS